MISPKVKEDALTMLEMFQHPDRFCAICFKKFAYVNIHITRGEIMPTAFEYENGELMDSYGLGEAECPVCSYPVIGHFKNGELVETEPCQACEVKRPR